jgi:hypothetical protein
VTAHATKAAQRTRLMVSDLRKVSPFVLRV